MNHRGFTLVETIMALFLLGLVAITVLPIIHVSFDRVGRNDIKLEMMNIGEMAIEKLKAFDRNSINPLYIHDMKIEDIIDEFSDKEDVLLTLQNESKNRKYTIEILKEEKNKKMWRISVSVYYKKGGKHEEVIYNALIPKK